MYHVYDYLLSGLIVENQTSVKITRFISSSTYASIQ